MYIIEPFLFWVVFLIHQSLFPTKNYALSRNDYYILTTRDLLFAFQMLIIFMVFYSKLALLISIFVFIKFVKNVFFLCCSRETPYLMFVGPSKKKNLNLTGIKLEFLLEEHEKLDLELFKKAFSFEKFDAIILNNISKTNKEIIKNIFGKKIKIFNYA